MTDEEIRTRLQQADDLLQQYVEVVLPVAAALALRHDAATGVKHNGILGCYADGIDYICLHIAENEVHPPIKDDPPWLNSMASLQAQFFAGLKHINLGAFF